MICSGVANTFEEDYPPPPARKDSIFRSIKERGRFVEAARPLVLPVPPNKKSSLVDGREMPRFNVSEILKKRDQNSYSMGKPGVLIRQKVSLTSTERCSRGFGHWPESVQNSNETPEFMDSRKTHFSSAVRQTENIFSVNNTFNPPTYGKLKLRILSPPHLILDNVLNDENIPPITPIKALDLDYKSKNPPTVSVRELTNCQSTFKAVPSNYTPKR